MQSYNLFNNYTGLLIRFDDITQHMNWHLMKKCEDLFLKYNVRPLVGVIPKNKDDEFLKYERKENFWEKVREWKNNGWEISMHGFNHVYDTETKKKDFFGYGGRSEFFGHSYDIQKRKIEDGLLIFKNEKINIRSFFAPNHTYDINTLRALKECGISTVIDGYGLVPYSELGLNFIPQLFYKEIMLPFGIQSTQIHLNYMDDDKFNNFSNFIRKHHKKIIDFETALKKINNNLFSRFSRFSLEKSLKLIRSLKN